MSEATGDDIVMVGALAVGAFLLYLMMNQKAGAAPGASVAASGSAITPANPGGSVLNPAGLSIPGANLDMGGSDFGQTTSGWD